MKNDTDGNQVSTQSSGINRGSAAQKASDLAVPDPLRGHDAEPRLNNEKRLRIFGPHDNLSHAAEVLEQCAERLLMSYTARFEQDAEAFYRATGFIAPGRSVPAAMGGYDEDQRQAEWDKWISEQSDQFRWALLAGAAALRKVWRMPLPAPPEATR